MTNILSLFQSGVSSVVPLVVLLGLLIFVHELGHFLVAKYYKVRVEVFSLGFGPKILKFQHGETQYAISILPLGGYVKMFGDDPTADIPAEDKKFSYIHKPVGQRVAVVLAGPLMNFFFAILLYTIIALVGSQTIANKVGDIREGTPAHVAGFRSGDIVKSINGTAVNYWDDITKKIEQSPGVALNFEVERTDKSPAAFAVTPKLVPNKNIMSWDSQIGEVDGLNAIAMSSTIGVKKSTTPAAVAGLVSGDQIVEVNGTKIEMFRELAAKLKEAVGTSTELKLSVRRLPEDLKAKDAELIAKEVVVPVNAEWKKLNDAELMMVLGLESSELYLGGVTEKSPAEAQGMKRGDRLVAIDGETLLKFDQVPKKIHAFQPTETQRSIRIEVLRDGEPKEFAVSPNLNERTTAQGGSVKQFEIGVFPLIFDPVIAAVEWKTSSPLVALENGFSQTWKWTSLTVLSFVRLFQGQVSSKNVGSFISIGAMAKKSWQMGLASFLHVMGIISINLFILNLLPIPILDGGHLVFYTIEIIRGAPLSMSMMEKAQKVGLALLLLLMIFAFYNDISRHIFS